MAKKNKPTSVQSTQFPPVVAVLGHVDHGKTTLLDAIRKTNIAQREHGSITQKIGASSIEVAREGVKRRITFIDTPGHQTFFAMRTRGATVADIGLLVVSAVDGIMPQTEESIKLFTDAKTPFIVVLTKVDVETKNIEKVKQQLVKFGVMLEGLGGEVPVIEVSAKTGKNVGALLDIILLVFDMQQDTGVQRSESALLEGVIIESKLDQKAGPRATVVVKNGILHVRDEVICDGVVGRVRILINDRGQHLDSATVGDAVEVLGFPSVPKVGSIVSEHSEHSDRQINQQVRDSDTQIIRPSGSPSSSEFSGKLHRDENALSIVLVADTLGSLEAIVHALPKEIVILDQKTGEIATSDVLLAKSTNSLLIGFNTIVKPKIVELVKTEKVLLKNYNIIYELLDQLQDVLEGKAVALQEEVYGSAKVLASFPYEKTKVLGIMVVEGRVARGDKARLMRGETVIGESTISSVRQEREQVSKIEKGGQGGIILFPFLDFTIGDMVLCHG